MDDLLTLDDVGRELKLGGDLLMAMVEMGQLPGFWIHGSWRTRRDDFREWQLQMARGPSAISVAHAIAAVCRAQADRMPASASTGLSLLAAEDGPNPLAVLEAAARRSKTFCAAPWVHFLTIPDGSVLPCCMAKEAIRKECGDGVNVRKTDPAVIWNGPEFRKIRQALLDGETIPHCVTCYHNEEIGRPSYREKFNLDYFGENGTSRRTSFLERLPDPNDPLLASRPVFIDIRLGNICNLKCRMCGPALSSQIEKDEVASAWVGGRAETPIGANVSDWPEAVGLLAQLKDFVVDALHIELVGGEPTLNQAHITMLQHLVDEGLAGNVQVLLITNMTSSNDHIYELLSHFKNATVHFSVEAIGAVNDYIRFPARWASTSGKLMHLKAKYSGLTFGISPTFQAYNILDVTDLFDWCLEQGLGFGTGNILLYPGWLSVLVLPRDVRLLAASRVEAWLEARAPEDSVRAELTTLINYLRDDARSASDEEVQDFIRYTNDLDRTRRQDVRESLPELYALFTRHHAWDHEAYSHRILPIGHAALDPDCAVEGSA